MVGLAGLYRHDRKGDGQGGRRGTAAGFSGTEAAIPALKNCSPSIKTMPARVRKLQMKWTATGPEVVLGPCILSERTKPDLAAGPAPAMVRPDGGVTDTAGAY